MTAIEHVKEGNIEYFLNQETRNRYSRVVGGLAWPFANKPGFLVVVAEDFTKLSEIGRCLYVLAKREGPYLDDLFRYWQELRGQYSADPWLGDPSFKVNIEYFRKEGDRQGFMLLGGPHYDDPRGLSSYFQITRSMLKKTRKVLHFGKESILPGYLQSLPAEEMMKPACEHPPVAALGYAVAYLFYNGVDGRMTAKEADELLARYGRRI